MPSGTSMFPAKSRTKAFGSKSMSKSGVVDINAIASVKVLNLLPIEPSPVVATEGSTKTGI